MSALTEKLGLTVYDDTDNPTVKSWRDTINKNAVQSAFSIIDAYAIATDARITTVEQSRKLFRISATEEIANIYLATAPEIESLSNGIQIQVSFDATNTGAATININSTGAKSLKKISLSGVTVDIEPNDIIANKIYTFEYFDGVFIKVGGFSSSEIIMIDGSQDNLLQIGSGGKIQESPVALYNGKISGDGINIGNMLTVENNNIELPTFVGTIPGTYLGLTVDAYGRITSTNTPVPNPSGAFVLNSVDGALSWSTKAPDSDKLDGIDSTGFVNTTDTQTINGAKTFGTLPTLPTTTPSADQAVRKGYADATYLLTTGKAADSDKLDGIDSTGFVNTTDAQTINGEKTFGTLPTLPTTTPTANQAVRKGYADATYLGITAKATDSSKLNNHSDAFTPAPTSIPLSNSSSKIDSGWLNLGTGIANTGGAVSLNTSGVSAGTYGGFTIDTYGRITSANNSQTILADGNGLNYSVVTHVSSGNCYITILAADGSSQSATNYSTFNVGGTVFKMTASVQFYIGGADYFRWIARGIAGNDAQLFVYAINNNGSLAFGVSASPNLTVVGSYRTDLGSGIGSTPGLGNMVSNVFSFAAGSKCRVIGRINVKQETGSTWVAPTTAKVINYPIFATDYMLQTAKTMAPATYGSITNCYMQYRIDRDKCSVTATADNSSISTSATSGQVSVALIMPGKATVVTNYPAFVEIFASDGWRIANGSMTLWGDYTIMAIYKTMLGGLFNYDETGLKFLISAEYAIDE